MPEWGLVLLGSGCGILGTAIGACIGVFGQYFAMKKQEENKFRLAALDKRLAVAQEAFRRAGIFISVMGNREACREFETECFEWWDANCLYLAPEVRESFESCLNRADLAADVSIREGRDVRLEVQLLRLKIARSVGLPDLGISEQDDEGTAST